MRPALAILIGCLSLTAATSTAGDFRVETKIYATEKEEQPVSENLTLYQTGVFYDFLAKPGTVTIFDPSAGRFIVLDPGRSVKMVVTTDQIEGLLQKLRDWAKEQKDPFVRFLGQPEFIEEAAEEKDTLVLSNSHMTYRIKTTKPADDASLAAYRQFNDWYARFNGLGGMLPFPRLAVNESLFRRKLIPQQVDLKIPSQDLSLRAVHRTKWLLNKHDGQRIKEARDQMATFREVSPDEFLHGLQEHVADVK